jgi:micrococcal nuclease
MHIAFWAQEPQPPRLCFSGQAEYTVDTIVDGRTVLLDRNGAKLKVVLMGVRTEPLHGPKNHGREAKKFLVNLLKGEKVYVEYDRSSKDQDEFGTTLAYLHRAPDGLFVNLEVVRQGYGRVSSKVMFRHFTVFKAYEAKAMNVQKGMWAR